MSHRRSEKIRVLVAFGDISGFTNFMDSITNDETEYYPLMTEYDELVQSAKVETGYQFDHTGDGFMCWVDVTKGDAGQAAIRFLKSMAKLCKKINALFAQRRKQFVAPAGFRIVGATGHVHFTKDEWGHPLIRGKHVNMAHNALDDARGHGVVCDVSLHDLIPDRLARRNGFSFRLLGKYLWVLKVR